jgi:hypothetical protein
MVDSPRDPFQSPLFDVADQFVVGSEVLACPQHAAAVREFARQLGLNETSDEAVLNQVDESLRCFECRLIAAGVLGGMPTSEDSEQLALESFLRSRRSARILSPASADPTTLPFQRRSRRLNGLWQGRSIVVLASIAAGLLIVIGSVLVWQNYRLRQETGRLEARLAELRTDLPNERLTIVSHFEPVIATSQLPAVSSIAITLTPGLARSIAPTRESSVELTKNVNSLAVSLTFDGSPEAGYMATVEDASGKVLHTVSDLKSVPSIDAKRSVTFTIPTQTLTPGGYIIRLNRTTSSGGVEVVNDYRLFVSAPPPSDIRLGALVVLSNDTDAMAAIAIADYSAVLPTGKSTMVLPPGDFSATILSKCGMVTQLVTIRPSMQNSIVVRCVR